MPCNSKCEPHDRDACILLVQPSHYPSISMAVHGCGLDWQFTVLGSPARNESTGKHGCRSGHAFQERTWHRASGYRQIIYTKAFSLGFISIQCGSSLGQHLHKSNHGRGNRNRGIEAGSRLGAGPEASLGLQEAPGHLTGLRTKSLKRATAVSISGLFREPNNGKNT